MTSPVVAIGSNQCWSFIPACDLFDSSSTAHALRITTATAASAADQKKQENGNGNGNANANQASTTTSAAAKLTALFSKLDMKKSASNASASPPPSTNVDSSLHVLLIEPGDIL